VLTYSNREAECKDRKQEITKSLVMKNGGDDKIVLGEGKREGSVD